jgi:repressor LexA
MSKPLSETQQKILDAIRKHFDEDDRPPTVRDIQTAAGLSSPSLVKYHLDILKELGFVRQRPGTARGVEIVADSELRRRSTLVNVQVVGTIAAGVPIQAAEIREDLFLTHDVAKVGDYALRVKGNSMIGDHIEDGDIVIVRNQDSADDGDTVVALLLNGTGGPEGEATLKRFYREKPRRAGETGRIRLEPRNPTMQPIFVAPHEIKIQGRVVGVIRLMA